MRVPELLTHVRAGGGRLVVTGDRLRYVAHDGRDMTDELRSMIRGHREAIVAFLKTPRAALPPEDAHLAAPLVAELLAHLADHGVWIGLDEDDCPQFHFHEDDDRGGVDEGVIDELHERVDALIAWLQKPVEELADAELEALGFGPGVRDAETRDDVMGSLFADGPLPFDSNSPPAEQEAQAPPGRCQNPKCGVHASAEILRKYGGYCWSCAQTRQTRDEEIAS